jgi:hypothetical protein
MYAVSDQNGGQAGISAAVIAAASIVHAGCDTVQIYSQPKASASQPKAARPLTSPAPRSAW